MRGRGVMVIISTPHLNPLHDANVTLPNYLCLLCTIPNPCANTRLVGDICPEKGKSLRPAAAKECTISETDLLQKYY